MTSLHPSQVPIANEVFSELLRLDPTQPQSLVFHDPEGHEVELMVSDAQDPPLVADADDIPAGETAPVQLSEL